MEPPSVLDLEAINSRVAAYPEVAFRRVNPLHAIPRGPEVWFEEVDRWALKVG